MPADKGIIIETVAGGSAAEAAGLHPGDVITHINSMPQRDVIDFMYTRDAEVFDIEYLRDRKKRRLRIMSDGCSDMGLTFRALKVKTCRNNCVFCFVKQLPRGLRKSLYVKDEDYRLSFLYGNYTTLSNLADHERRRIVEQHLSPMYVSVHATNRALRNRLLGNPKAADIMKELKFFAAHKIRMHIQIVLCPGYNDGKELQKTIQDTYRYYPYVSSMAVVPVGLTKHRQLELAPVTRDVARKTIALVNAFQKRFRKKHGESIVHCADEMYIAAELPFPPLREYGELPQAENGVGLVPLFQSQARRIKLPKSAPKGRFIAFTGVSFFPYLKKFIDRLSEKEHLPISLIPVENRFFGESVTVTGLLTGRDILSALHDNIDHHDTLIVPDVVLRDGDSLLLDNVSLADIADATGLRVLVTDGTPQGLIESMSSHSEGR